MIQRFSPLRAIGVEQRAAGAPPSRRSAGAGRPGRPTGCPATSGPMTRSSSPSSSSSSSGSDAPSFDRRARAGRPRRPGRGRRSRRAAPIGDVAGGDQADPEAPLAPDPVEGAVGIPRQAVARRQRQGRAEGEPPFHYGARTLRRGAVPYRGIEPPCDRSASRQLRPASTRSATKGLVCALLGEGAHRAVAGDEGGVAAERPEPGR